MEYNFVLGHIPGTANAAADYLSRALENPGENLELKTKYQLPAQEIEIVKRSSKINQPSENSEEPAFFSIDIDKLFRFLQWHFDLPCEFLSSHAIN